LFGRCCLVQRGTRRSELTQSTFDQSARHDSSVKRSEEAKCGLFDGHGWPNVVMPRMARSDVSKMTQWPKAELSQADRPEILKSECYLSIYLKYTVLEMNEYSVAWMVRSGNLPRQAANYELCQQKWT
jgi:hypothetical protein